MLALTLGFIVPAGSAFIAWCLCKTAKDSDRDARLAFMEAERDWEFPERQDA